MNYKPFSLAAREMSLARKTHRGGRPTPVARLRRIQELMRAEILLSLDQDRMEAYRLLGEAIAPVDAALDGEEEG